MFRVVGMTANGDAFGLGEEAEFEKLNCQ